MKDELEGFCPMAVVKLKEVSQWLAGFERDNGQQRIARERKVLSGFGSSMPVTIFLPSAGISLVVVAVFDAPMFADCLGAKGFLLWIQAGEEHASMAFDLRLLVVLARFLLYPLTQDGDGRAGSRQCGMDRRDALYRSFAGVNATVIAFQAQVKKGEPFRALAAPSNRLEVLALVPMR
jgi:hypothetical protein